VKPATRILLVRRIGRAGLAALALAAFAPVARAQEAAGKGTPVKAVKRLNRAPVNKEVLQVRLPRPTVTQLPNGLTVIVLEQHKLPTIAFNLWVKPGALADPKGLPGLASFTADMLREGTERRTSAQLAAQVDEIGASLNAAADFGSSVATVRAGGLVENTDALLDLLSDVVLRPTFPADELEKYKQRKLAVLEQERADPSFLAEEKLHQALYGEFPAAVVEATPESVKHAAPADLKAFHDRYYRPGNAILGVVGDVKAADALRAVQKYFGGWQGAAEAPSLPAVPKPTPAKVILVDRPGSVQTNILAGDLAIRRNDPDYVALTVMNRILGGGPAARLFLDLREEKGYTYGAYSEFSALVYPGVWEAETEVRNAVTDPALRDLFAELRKVRDEPVPADELDEARRSIVARFALSLERPEELLTDWLTVQYFGLPEDYWDTYPAHISAISPQAVQQVARKYIDLDHLQLVCVGEAAQIRGVVAKYGAVETYDTTGKRLQ
jgi:zinc protease